MMLLAKAALGVGGTLALAGAYTFHEGVIRIDVDEHRAGGSHVHMWVPAAAVPMAMHLVPQKHLREVAEHSREALPIVEVVVYLETGLIGIECLGAGVEEIVGIGEGHRPRTRDTDLRFRSRCVDCGQQNSWDPGVHVPRHLFGTSGCGA